MEENKIQILENKVQTNETIYLEKAYTFFMMPFYIKDGDKIIPLKSNIWKRAKMNIDKGILYSHIQDFISKSVMEDENKKLTSDKKLTSHDYHIYSLSSDNNRFDAMLDSNMEHSIITKKYVNGKKETQQISFRFNNTSNDKPQFFSPKLIVCPNAKVGILIFSIEIVGKKDVETLTKLNYELFKTYKDESSQSSFIYIPKQLKIRRNEEELETMRKSIRTKIKKIKDLRKKLNAKCNNGESLRIIAKICEEVKVEYEVYKKKNAEFLFICAEKLQGDQRVIDSITYIDRAFDKEVKKAYSIREMLDHYWTMRQFTESLLSDLEGKYIRADDFRLHVFTYLQVTKEASLDPNLLPCFSRIIRCQDQDYLSLPSSFGNPVYEQLYENIIIGSTVEGGGVLTFLQGKGDDFMASFSNGPLTHSYLWIYLLVIMQRHTLLQLSRELAEEYRLTEDSSEDSNKENEGAMNVQLSDKEIIEKEKEETEKRLNNLRNVMDEMTIAKINTYFTDVSDHSHLNALYSFCCRNLSIDRYFSDVENKLYTLKEKLEQEHDAQMEIYERLKLELEKKEDRRQQNITKWIGVVAVVLTLFSALSDSYDLFSADKLNWIPQSLPSFKLVSSSEFISSICHLLILLGAFSIVGAIAWKVIDYIQKEIYK